MTFLAPAALWLLALLPILVFGYLRLLARRRRAVRYASLRLVVDAMCPSDARRRHVPAALLLLCLATSVFAIARPATMLDTPAHERTLILAMDVSTSMAATDVAPSRFAAAKAAAAAFIARQPAGVRIGIVAFAGHADLIHPPTGDHAEAIAALDRLYLQHDTSIGTGLLASLLTLFPDENLAGHLDLFGLGRSPVGLVARHDSRPGPAGAPHQGGHIERRTPGTHPSAAIVLLTDGRDTMGPRADKGAVMAAERGVRIYTVGVGSRIAGKVGSEGVPAGIDERTLQSIASTTRGRYFHAPTARDLHGVYRDLPGQMVLNQSMTELTALVSALAAMLLLVAGLLSASWSHRSTEPVRTNVLLEKRAAIPAARDAQYVL